MIMLFAQEVTQEQCSTCLKELLHAQEVFLKRLINEKNYSATQRYVEWSCLLRNVGLLEEKAKKGEGSCDELKEYYKKFETVTNQYRALSEGHEDLISVWEEYASTQYKCFEALGWKEKHQGTQTN